jgi:hypothetical protein
MAVRGTIGDEPWGWTLGKLAADKRSVRITLRSEDGKEFRIVFDNGLVVAATSPAAQDAVPRIALTNHFILAAQVNELKRCLATAPNLDEVDVVGAAARLGPEQTRALRIRTITQRAARTFSVDAGEFEIEECVTSQVDVAIDVRAIIFMGARLNLHEDRLRFGLRKFGQRFVLKPSATATLDAYNFTREERPLLMTLASPTSLAELEANHREVDSRAVQAVIYSLASCDALVELDLTDTPQSSSGLLEMSMAQGTPKVGAPAKVDEFFEEQPTIARTTSDAVPTPMHTQETVRAEKARSMLDTFKTQKVTTVRPNALKAHEVVELIKERTDLLARGADHFTLLGVAVDASVEEIHAAYVELARHISKKRLGELGIVDKGMLAEGLLAQAAIAFTVLTDRIRRSEYVASLAKRR